MVMLEKNKMSSNVIAIIIVVVISYVNGLLNLQGANHVAGFVGTNRTISCYLVRDKKVVNITEVETAFVVTWKFIPIGGVNQETLATITGSGLSKPVVWSKNTTKYTNSKSFSLDVNFLSLRDAGTYQCELDGMKFTSNLSVVDAITCHNLNHTITLHQQAQFECRVIYNGMEPPSLSWQHDKQILKSRTEKHNKTYVVATLNVNATADVNGNVYICNLKYSGVFHSYCLAYPPIEVYYPVSLFMLNISPSTIQHRYKAGETVTMFCHARGNPHPKYMWTFTPKDRRKPQVTVSDVSHYTIQSVRRDNEGVYTCTVSNSFFGSSYNQSKVISIAVTGQIKAEGYATFITSDSSKVQETDADLKNKHIKPEISPYAIGAMATAGLAVLLIIVFIVLAMKFRARDKKLKERFSRVHDELLDDQEVELLDENIQPRGLDEPSQYSQLRQCWEIPRKDIRLSELIARGVYVEVWKGRMKKHPERDDVMRVAIKKLLPETTEKGRKFFLAEMEVAKVLQSDINVIQLIGCYTLNEPWLIMLEYAHEGTLVQFLHRYRPGGMRVEMKTSSSRSAVRLKNYKVDSHKMLSLAAQVVSGLKHISKFKLICYRLRSASVLVGKGGTCKLSGFGFPQDVTERNLYEADSLPINTLSPETLLHDVYSTMTDVWAYGILFWEILHFCATPYPTLCPETVSDKVTTGYHMEAPPHCSDQLYDLLESCWEWAPDKRPDYDTILQELSGLAVQHEIHIMLDKLPAFAKAPENCSEDSDSL